MNERSSLFGFVGNEFRSTQIWSAGLDSSDYDSDEKVLALRKALLLSRPGDTNGDSTSSVHVPLAPTEDPSEGRVEIERTPDDRFRHVIQEDEKSGGPRQDLQGDEKNSAAVVEQPSRVRPLSRLSRGGAATDTVVSQDFLRKCLVHSLGDIEHAARIVRGFVEFRQEECWEFRLRRTADLEVALRSGMHWLLPRRSDACQSAMRSRLAAQCAASLDDADAGSQPHQPQQETQTADILLEEELLQERIRAQVGSAEASGGRNRPASRREVRESALLPGDDCAELSDEGLLNFSAPTTRPDLIDEQRELADSAVSGEVFEESEAETAQSANSDEVRAHTIHDSFSLELDETLRSETKISSLEPDESSAPRRRNRPTSREPPPLQESPDHYTTTTSSGTGRSHSTPPAPLSPGLPNRNSRSSRSRPTSREPPPSPSPPPRPRSSYATVGAACLVYNPAHLDTNLCPLALYQKMACFLTERATDDRLVQLNGVSFLIDCRNISVLGLSQMLSSLSDVRRGVLMWRRAFPIRVRRCWVVDAPLGSATLIRAALALLSPGLRDMLKFAWRSSAVDGPREVERQGWDENANAGDVRRSSTTDSGLRALVRELGGLFVLPEALGGNPAEFDWDTMLDCEQWLK